MQMIPGYYLNDATIKSQLLSPVFDNVAMSKTMFYQWGFLSGETKLETSNTGNPLTWGSSLIDKAIISCQN